MSSTKERPILFSAPMVRAILEGRKTQTRRVVKGPIWVGGLDSPGIPPHARHIYGGVATVKPCPYGKPGDRLWVREAFGYEVRSLGGTPHEKITYRASNPDAVHCYDCNGMELPMKWKPSIHMPRWASRITLEIVSVRVERLNEISDEDAIAEGVQNSLHLQGGRFANENFAHLWWTISGDGSWEANPWVWVVEFKRVQQ